MTKTWHDQLRNKNREELLESLDELTFEVQMDILQHMTNYLKNSDAPDITGRARLQAILEAWVDFGIRPLGIASSY